METAVAQLRGAIVLSEGGVDQLRGAQPLGEIRTQQLTQVGAAALSEVGGIIQAFKEELEMGKAERFHQGECLKGELRELVQQVQGKFAEVEAAIARFTTTSAATAAATAAAEMGAFSSQGG